MSVFERDYARPAYSTAQVSGFATKVYGWMTLGLLVTALVALLVVQSGLYVSLLPFWWLPTFGTLAVAMVIRGRMNTLTYGGMASLFLLYSGLQGVFFGTVLPLYAMQVGGQVIWSAFLTAGLIFGVAVLYGLFTKSDLTKLSKILQVALFGLIGITLVYFIASFFVHIPALTLLISYIGLIIFVGLTAYDAQQIRNMSTKLDGNGAVAGKLSLMMALKMYLNVIMIFWYLLQILSRGRR